MNRREEAGRGRGRREPAAGGESAMRNGRILGWALAAVGAALLVPGPLMAQIRGGGGFPGGGGGFPGGGQGGGFGQGGFGQGGFGQGGFGQGGFGGGQGGFGGGRGGLGGGLGGGQGGLPPRGDNGFLNPGGTVAIAANCTDLFL